MKQETKNPLLNSLKKIPGISITLPTKAILYSEGEVSEEIIESGGEIHIRPLSTRDELLMRTSDLILNGQAFSHVCKNSIEGINLPLELYQADHDAILLGLRIATYGDIFPINIPNALYDETDDESEKNLSFDLNLRSILQDGSALEKIEDYQVTIERTGQVVTVQPLRLKDSIFLLHQQLDDNAKIRARRDYANTYTEDSVEKREADAQSNIEEVFARTAEEVTDLQDRFLMNSIRDVDGIKDKELLMAWYSSPDLSANDFYPVRLAMEKFGDLGIKQTMDVTDPRTGKSWETALPINPIDFFVSGPAGATYPA